MSASDDAPCEDLEPGECERLRDLRDGRIERAAKLEYPWVPHLVHVPDTNVADVRNADEVTVQSPEPGNTTAWITVNPAILVDAEVAE